MRRLLPTLAILLAFANPAAAQFVDNEQLLKVKALEVKVADNVIDGCLSEPNSVKIEAEVVLRRSGIRVTDTDRSHYLYITALGYEISGGCAVSWGIEVWIGEPLQDGTVGLVKAYDYGGMLTGHKSSLQQRLRAQVNETVTHLANEILKARGN